jgi:cytochrome P450
VFHPDKFQAFVLGQRGQDSMVQAPRQLAFTDFYMPATAELAKEVFAQEATGAITQGLAQEGGYTAFSTLLGKDNLLVVKDSLRHATLRALLQPAFSAEAIRTYLPAIQALVARHLGDWQAAGSEGVKAYPCLKMLTFDFILQVRISSCR